jgi:hypothetical protein
MLGVVRKTSIFAAGRNSTCDKMMAGLERKVTVTTNRFVCGDNNDRLLYNQRTHITKNILKMNDRR